MMMLKGEEIRHTHSKNELDSMKKMKELSLMSMEQMLGDPDINRLVGTYMLIGHIKITITPPCQHS
jgi:hypothetical protein